jgi:putative redox protein
MKAVVTWKGGMGFTGYVPSGHEVPMDTFENVGGKNSAPRPIELLLASLGGCTGMDIITILGKMRKQVTALDIEVEADQATDYPRKLTAVTITYVVKGKDLDEGSVRRAIELSEEKYCSVGASLRQPVVITSKLKMVKE